MLNIWRKYIILFKFKEQLGIILVFSCSIYILSTRTLLFFNWTKTKIGSPLPDQRRHFGNTFLAGNDHVIDSSPVKTWKISHCVFLDILLSTIYDKNCYVVWCPIFLLATFKVKAATVRCCEFVGRNIFGPILNFGITMGRNVSKL